MFGLFPDEENALQCGEICQYRQNPQCHNRDIEDQTNIQHDHPFYPGQYSHLRIIPEGFGSGFGIRDQNRANGSRKDQKDCRRVALADKIHQQSGQNDHFRITIRHRIQKSPKIADLAAQPRHGAIQCVHRSCQHHQNAPPGDMAQCQQDGDPGTESHSKQGHRVGSQPDLQEKTGNRIQKALKCLTHEALK